MMGIRGPWRARVAYAKPDPVVVAVPAPDRPDAGAGPLRAPAPDEPHRTTGSDATTQVFAPGRVLPPGSADPGETPHRVAGGSQSSAPTDTSTQVLDARVAAAVADPFQHTEVLPRPVGPAPTVGGSGPGPAPVVSRRTAAEVGLYAGAGLMLVAIGGVALRGWTGWDSAARWSTAGLTIVAMLAAGLFVRLPWSRVLTDERRRAVSALLTTGAVLAVACVGVAVHASRGADRAVGVAQALGAVLALMLVNGVARTPLSESALLATLAWAGWVVVAPGPSTWITLALLGCGWVLLGFRRARGRRTAMVCGALLGLAACVGMAAGEWAWPTRAGLALLAIVGLGAFLRGRANYWLALGAGAAAALAASVAGDVLGPALALLVGGLATMVVSGIALRGAR